MVFSKEFLSNKMFMDQAFTFDHFSFTPVEGEEIQTGAILQENGDVLFRLYLPDADSVSVFASVSRNVCAEIELSRLRNGLFEGTLPFQENMTGSANVVVKVDGKETLIHDLPMIWQANRPRNAVEIPDPEGDFYMLHDVPHGHFIRDTFWAEAMNNWEHCYIYAPPGYMNTDEVYPVLYLVEGGGDNETTWEYVGRLSNIMDTLIAQKKAVPMLVVMCNIMLREGGHVSSFDIHSHDRLDKAFERMLIDSCIPYMEETYRVKTGKWNRAIAGLSLGSYITNDIGLGNPEVFGNIGHFTAGLATNLEPKYSYERPWKEAVKKGADYFAENYKIYFRSTTSQEDHLEFYEEDDRIYAEAGIDKLSCYHRLLYPPRVSKWNSWRMGLRDFAQLIFKDESGQER